MYVYMYVYIIIIIVVIIILAKDYACNYKQVFNL